MLFFRILKRLDWSLLVPALLLFTIGLLMIFSANFSLNLPAQTEAWKFVRGQLLAFLVAVVFFVLMVLLDYDNLRKYATWIYLISLGLLLVVLLTGRSASGARRWLSLGFSFQPSELMKLSFIIILARTLCYTRDQLKSLRVLLPFIFYLMIPFVLISKQPDLGTALTLAGIFLGMLLWAGLHPFILFLLFSPILSIWLRHHWLVWVPYILILWYLFYEFRAKIVDAVIFLFLNIGIAAGFDRLWGMLHDYQQRRILSFFNPGLDPFGSGYHALQSKIAVGSGGLFGRGFLQGSQTHYAFIPEQHTDFIFSVIGEEFGFVGSLVLLLLFGFLIWRLIVLAGRVKNSFASFVIIGVASLFTFHVLVNIGMAVGIMPVVGVPLPFLSYGGSALLVTFIALGIVQSIIVREEKLHF